MNIIDLNERQDLSNDIKLKRTYDYMGELLKELKKKDLPHNIIQEVNSKVEIINVSTLTGNELRRLVKNKQTEIIKLMEKELKMVPKNYYRNLWLALGMSAFGLPLGVAFGSIMGNMGLLALGIPIGMVLGLVVGKRMDTKALEEGRQLEIELKY